MAEQMGYMDIEEGDESGEEVRSGSEDELE